MAKWTQLNLTKFIKYFYNQWLIPPFDTWQIFRTSPGFATIAINESFNKQLKETFTKYKLRSLVHIMKVTLPSVCKYYSEHAKPFAIFPSQISHRKEVVTKANELTVTQFVRLDFNNIRFDAVSQHTGSAYSHFIRVCNPVYCSCSTYLDLAYCHHILAINKLNLANIILDPTYVKPVEARRLCVRKTKKSWPRNIGKALERLD